MLKKILLSFVSLSIVSSLWAQTPPSGVISRPPTNADTNAPAIPAPFPTNATNTASIERLSGQLQSLRVSVDEILPALSAFNESVSNSSPHSLTGTIAEVVAGALQRNQSATNASGQTSTNKVLGLLQSLLNTNTVSASQVNRAEAQELQALQNDLQSISLRLQRLNIGGTNAPALTPTGR